MNIQSQSLPHVASSQIFSVKALKIEGNTLLPEKKLENGNVIIQVLEGKIEKINISANTDHDEIDISNALSYLKQGETPIVRNIDRNIQMSSEIPTKNIRVALIAGAKPEPIEADAKVIDERPLRLFSGVGSAGTLGTGNLRTNVGIQHANLWNRDHIGTFQFQTSPTEPSRTQIYSVGYRIPFYNQFAALDAFYAYSDVESVMSAAHLGIGPFGFTGKDDIAGFRAHRLLTRISEYDHRMSLGWNWRHFNDNCTFGGNTGSAACDRLVADVTITPLSLSYTGQKDG